MNKQLQTLLDDSLVHYRGRHLKKALNTAKIALEFGLTERAKAEDLVSANLLLARIFNTNARYQNEPASFQKALQYIAEAKRLNDLLADPSADARISLNAGKVHLNLKEFAPAETCLRKALAIARLKDDVECTVLSLALLSQLFLAKNEVEQGVMFAEEGFRFLENNVPNNHVALWAEVYLQLSQAYLKRQEYSRSLEMSQHLLQLSRQLGDVEKEALALHNVAVVCGVKSNYKIGMQYFLEALDKCETIGYRELSAQIQINLGTLYAHLYNYEEAIHRYQKVLAEHSDILEDKIRVALYNNLGNIFFTTEQPQQALAYFEKANALADECQNQEMLAHSLAQLSRTKISLNRLSEAEQDAQWAAELFERLGDVNGKQIHLMNLGHLAHLKNHFDEAVELTNQSVETAKKLKDDAGEIRGYKLLSLIFKAKGDFAKALEFQERYAEIQEEFARVQRNRQVLDLEIRQAIREKQKEIEQLTKENEYQALLLQKSDQIARQNLELLRANEELRQFAYVASHDLREPLRMIGSYTQIIERLTQDKLGEKEKQYFTFVTEGVHRMSNLLEGLLKYATIANAAPEIEEVRLDDVLLICQTNLKIRIEETQAQMQCEPLPVVRSNQPLLTQLFQNLVSNALKFIPTGVQPSVRVFAESNETEHIVAVQDNGIGIPKEQQERIFEIFQRLHPRSKFEGTGIGLAICQKIVKRLGGRIWVESEEGEGATFFVALPK